MPSSTPRQYAGGNQLPKFVNHIGLTVTTHAAREGHSVELVRGDCVSRAGGKVMHFELAVVSPTEGKRVSARYEQICVSGKCDDCRKGQDDSYRGGYTRSIIEEVQECAPHVQFRQEKGRVYFSA